MKLINAGNGVSTTVTLNTLHEERQHFQEFQLLNQCIKLNALLEMNTELRLWSPELWHVYSSRRIPKFQG
jgi:hypothetical protein